MWSEDEEPDSTSPPLPTPTAISAPTSRGKRRLQSQLTLPPPEPRTLPEQTAFVSVKDTEQFTESEAPRSGYFTAKKKVTVFSETKISHLGDLKDCFPYAPPRHNNAKNCVFSVPSEAVSASSDSVKSGIINSETVSSKATFSMSLGVKNSISFESEDKITSVGTNVLSNALE